MYSSHALFPLKTHLPTRCTEADVETNFGPFTTTWFGDGAPNEGMTR